MQIAPFYVLDYPDWVQIVALDETDHLILVRQYRHGLGAVALELPCGGMDAADRDPVAAAARELAEETGYSADRWRLIASLSPNAANHSNRTHIVLAEGAHRTQAPADDPTERLIVERVPVTQAVAEARRGGMAQAMHVAALALALTEIGRWGASA